jgi:osmoprotectant transport system substrate-binding protein
LVRRRQALVTGIVAGATLVVLACSSEPAPTPANTALDDEAITIGAFDFGESEVLAEIYAQALEANGFEVDRVGRIGPREIVQPALAAGLVEFVPEYVGTAVEFLSLGNQEPVQDVDEARRALVRAIGQSHLVPLASSPAENTNVIVVTPQTAGLYDIESISELEPIAGELTFGGPPECPNRPFCLQGLERTYGLRFESFLPLDAGGPLTRQALVNRHVDVALAFSTDPDIEDAGLVVLDDDRALQPAENVTPVVRREVIEWAGEPFVRAVDSVSAALTTSALRSMNARVAAGDEPADAAARWLETEGLV